MSRSVPSVFVLLVLVAAIVGAADAQEAPHAPVTVTIPADADPAVRAEVLDVLARAEASVEVADAAEVAWQQRWAQRVEAGLANTPATAARLAAWWDRVGGLAGFALVVLALAGGLAAAVAMERRSGRRGPAPAAATPRFRARLGRAGAGLARDGVAVFAFAAASFALGLAILPTEPRAAWLTLSGFANHLVVVLVLIALLRRTVDPEDRHGRLAPLGDDEARRVWRCALIVFAVLVPVGLFRALVVALAQTGTEALVVVIATEAVATAVRIWFFWAVRAPIRGLIEHAFGNGRGAAQPPLVGWLARSWHVLYAALALMRLLVVTVGQVEGTTVGSAADYSFLALILLPFVIGGIRAWFDDRPAASTGTGISGSARALIQGVVAVAVLVFVARAWGLDPLAASSGGPEDRIAAALLEASAAVVVGWAIWRGIQALLDRWAPQAEDAGLDDEGFGKTGSRLDTLIPLIRSSALVVIATISLLTALAALGINITALLAGAGVVGLALGFGAQTLVKDVITGVFYLIEDAFRVGEYIVTDEGKGVIEKISLRSVRLRHHRGPLYTIPFGSMGTVQNHSRDWVKVKLLIRVPFDTDLEKVRKLIKRVGIAMQDEPEFAEHIIQPVKSQGVLEVDDSAMVIGIKFICKPGEQFVIRREAYARIQQAFTENGVEFAPKRVIVESDRDDYARARAGAAAAAAAHMGDGEMDAAS